MASAAAPSGPPPTAPPPLPPPPPPWQPAPRSESAHAHMRNLLSSATRRLPGNAEAHFHAGLLAMRAAEGEDALRAFTRARAIFEARVAVLKRAGTPVPPRLSSSLARLRAHTAQAAHLAAASKLSKEERAPLLDRLQADMVASTREDSGRPDVWNALALLHLGEGGFAGARDILIVICDAFPEYLDALNNLGLAELALGNETAALACFQKVVLLDTRHAEALSNYGVVLLRKGLYSAAGRAFRAAVEGAGPGAWGLSFAWAGLAIAEAAAGRLDEAEEAALNAEASADATSRARFTLLIGCVRTRRVSQALHAGDTSLDGRPSVFVDMNRRPPAAPLGTPARAARDEGGASLAGSPGLGVASSDAAGATTARAAMTASPCTPRVVTDKGSDPQAEGKSAARKPRQAIENCVQLLRSVARDIHSSPSSCALGAALRIRHDSLWEETGNRNYGAESAERLVEALESDVSDPSGWVQLALLQLSAGEYESARDFCVQAVSRDAASGHAWNDLGLSYQLNCELAEALAAYAKAISVTLGSCNETQASARYRESEGVNPQRTSLKEHASPSRVEENQVAPVKDSGSPEKSMGIQCTSLQEADDPGKVQGLWKTEESRGAKLTVIGSPAQAKDLEPSVPTMSLVRATQPSRSDGSDPENPRQNLEPQEEGGEIAPKSPLPGRSSETAPQPIADGRDLSCPSRLVLAAAYNNLGNAKRQEGSAKYDEAHTAYEKSLRLGGESAAVYNNLGLLYIARGQLDDAEKMLSHALTIAPFCDSAVSNLMKIRRLKAGASPAASTDDDDGDDYLDETRKGDGVDENVGATDEMA